MKEITWICVFCGHKQSSILGSRFVWRKEPYGTVKRRKCSVCLSQGVTAAAGEGRTDPQGVPASAHSA